MMRLVAIFMLVCGSEAVGQESPVRRAVTKDAPQREFNCVLWGDARPAGKVAGTTKMHAQLFTTEDQASEQFHAIKKTSDVVIQYKGSNELKRHTSAHMTNSVKWRTLFDWCNQTDHKFEDVSPDKWKVSSFFITSPNAPVRKEKKPVAMTFSLKEQLQAQDEDEGPVAAYVEEDKEQQDKSNQAHCVIAADSSQKDSTELNATLFLNASDAERNFLQSRAHGASLVIQYFGKREWKRHVSPVLTSVPWLSMFQWCQKLHADWKAQPKGSYFIKGMIGVPSKRSMGSFTKPVQVVAVQPVAQNAQEVDQGVSMVETAESAGAFVSANFAPKTTFEDVQQMLAHGMMRQTLSYTRYPGWDCNVVNRSDIRLAGIDMPASACKEACDKDMQCNGMQYDKSIGACYYGSIGRFNEKRCQKSEKTSVYLQKAQWAVDKSKLTKFEGKACAVKVEDALEGRGGTVLGVEKKVHKMSACRDVCADESGCTCFKFSSSDQTCVTMKACEMKQCEDSEKDDMYVHVAVSSEFYQKSITKEGIPW